MPKSKRFLRDVALVCTVAFLAGCAQELAPLGAYKVGNTAFNFADLEAQDAAEAHCWGFANQTNPTEWQMALRFAGIGGIGGFIGGGAGNTVASAIVGAAITTKNFFASALNYGMAVVFVNGANGVIYRDVLVWKNAGQCKKEEALGIHHIKPSDLERLRKHEIDMIPVIPARVSLTPEAVQRSAIGGGATPLP